MAGPEMEPEMSSTSNTSTLCDRGRRRWAVATVVVLAAVTVLSACSSGEGDQSAGAAPTTQVPPTAAPTTGVSPRPDRGPTTSAPRAPAGLPFAADTGPEVSSVTEGYPVLVSVTQGERDGYRRYVFTFKHADPEGQQPGREFARPAWDVRYVPASQAVMSGSGEPVVNVGANAHLRIAFTADMHYADGRSALTTSVNDEPPDLAFGGDFENRVSWFYGARSQRPFRVTYVDQGRVAVDIVR